VVLHGKTTGRTDENVARGIQMKLRIYRNWLKDRALAMTILIVSLILGIYTLALVFLVLLVRSFGHELSHAAIIRITGGKTEIISFGPGSSQYIDFTASVRALPFIYIAGAIFDTVLVLCVSCTLFVSADIGIVPGIVLKIFSVALLYLITAIHLFKKHSDFNNAIRIWGKGWAA
jgi:hypothetical protein